jgi:hypothetical protein
MVFEKLRRKKVENLPKLQGLVSVEGKGPQSYLVASTEQETQTSEVHIRGRLQNAHLIEDSVNPALAVKVSVGTVSGCKYPDDFQDFRDYLDS